MSVRTSIMPWSSYRPDLAGTGEPAGSGGIALVPMTFSSATEIRGKRGGPNSLTAASARLYAESRRSRLRGFLPRALREPSTVSPVVPMSCGSLPGGGLVWDGVGLHGEGDRGA